MDKFGRTYAVAFLMPLLFITGCAGGPLNETQLRRLEARMVELNQAINRADWAAWNEMSSPALHPRRPLEEFKKNLRLEENAAAWQMMRGELKRDCVCGQIAPTLLRCVFIIAVTLKEGAPRRQVLETWELWNGEWYWVYRDFHDTQGRCPAASSQKQSEWDWTTLSESARKEWAACSRRCSMDHRTCTSNVQDRGSDPRSEGNACVNAYNRCNDACEQR